MTDSFQVRIAKAELMFSSAHFITFNGDVCERLHGHNYRVSVDVHGGLDENQYVFDFVALRTLLQQMIAKLDHRVLLPTEHPLIQVRQQDSEVIATFRERRWVFPADDCVLLPVANTTAERLAEYLGLSLLDRLRKEKAYQPTAIQVEVDECEGQVGIWRRET